MSIDGAAARRADKLVIARYVDIGIAPSHSARIFT